MPTLPDPAPRMDGLCSRVAATLSDARDLDSARLLARLDATPSAAGAAARRGLLALRIALLREATAAAPRPLPHLASPVAAPYIASEPEPEPEPEAPPQPAPPRPQGKISAVRLEDLGFLLAETGPEPPHASAATRDAAGVVAEPRRKPGQPEVASREPGAIPVVPGTDAGVTADGPAVAPAAGSKPRARRKATSPEALAGAAALLASLGDDAQGTAPERPDAQG